MRVNTKRKRKIQIKRKKLVGGFDTFSIGSLTSTIPSRVVSHVSNGITNGIGNQIIQIIQTPDVKDTFINTLSEPLDKLIGEINPTLLKALGTYVVGYGMYRLIKMKMDSYDNNKIIKNDKKLLQVIDRFKKQNEQNELITFMLNLNNDYSNDCTLSTICKKVSNIEKIAKKIR